MIKIIIDTMLKSRGFTEYRNKKKSDGFFGGIHPIHVFFRSENPKTPLQIRETNNERQLIFFLSFITYFLSL